MPSNNTLVSWVDWVQRWEAEAQFVAHHDGIVVIHHASTVRALWGNDNFSKQRLGSTWVCWGRPDVEDYHI